MARKKKTREGEVQVKDAFMNLLRNKNNEADFFRARTRKVWARLFGQHVADHTRDILVRNRKLYIYVTQAPLRNQLHMVREGICNRLNKEFGEEYFVEVIIK